jgi:hypothetical protein
MKRLMLIGCAAFAFAALLTLPVAAIPLAPMMPAVTIANDLFMVRHGGRGHHYGWTQSRGLHLGFTRGRHRGWR